MQRIFLVLIFGFIFGGVVFGQQPGNAPVMEFQPLINFDEVFEQISEWFTDILKEYWVVIISLFFAWFTFMTVVSYLQGRVDRIKAERRIQETVKRDIALEESRIARGEARAEARRRMAAIFEGGAYKSEVDRQLGSSDLNQIIRREREHLGEHESIVRIDGTNYVRSSTSEGDVIEHKTLEQWRLEREGELTKSAYPFEVRAGNASYRDSDTDHEEFADANEAPAEREVLSFEESDFERWKEEQSCRLWEEYKADRRCERDYGNDGLDDYYDEIHSECDREYRRGEFRGGY